MIRKSTARWQGDGLHGTGALTTQSGVFHEQPSSFQAIAEEAKKACPLSKALAATPIALSAKLL
jgi:organic hydroperoxide reductase OsmC/OhrA